MKRLSKLISYIFHPIFIPIMGTLLYYLISPKFTPPEIQKGIVLSVFILTVVIPIIFFFLLKNIGWISSVFVDSVSERKIPIIINIILLFMVIYRVIPRAFSTELYYFFAGLMASLFATLILVLFKYKASMHVMGISGIIVFLLGLSIHFEVNVTIVLSLLVLILGAIASARLFLNAHSGTELVLGIILGALPQLFSFNYWL